MVDIQTISIVIASAGVLIAAGYYALQIRHQTRIRKTDLIIRLYSRMHSSEFDDAYPKIMNLQFEDYEDFLRKYGPRHSGKVLKLTRQLVLSVASLSLSAFSSIEDTLTCSWSTMFLAVE